VNRVRCGAIDSVYRRTNQRIHYLSCITMLAVVFPAAAWGQLYAMPYADTTYQYNSNVFALPSGAREPIGNGSSTLSDRLLEDYAGVDALYDWSLQEFYGNVEGRYFDYDKFSALDHDEYLLHGGMKWKLANLLDGVVDFRRERSMVPFLDFIGSQLFLQRQSVVTASANLQFEPDWRLESQGMINDLDSPRPSFPNLKLTEDSLREGLRYVGMADLSAGIDATFLNGHFNGDEFVLTPRYNQTTVEAAAKYVATGLSSFNGAIGYTRRIQEDAATISGTTGLLAYQLGLSDRTSLNIRLSRSVNTYVSYGSTEINTGVSLGATWNATAKVVVTPGYQWTYSSFPGANLAGLAVGVAERLDHYQLATLSVKYQIFNWLSLRPYAQYEKRDSDVGIYSFNRTLYGLELEVRLSGQADQPYELSLPE